MRTTARVRMLRGSSAVLAGTILAAATASPASEDGAEARAAAPRLTAELLSTGQQVILSEGLRARVLGEPGRIAIVKPKARPAGASDKPTRIGKPRRIRIPDDGTRRLRLRLDKRGRGVLSACRPLELLLRVKLGGSGAGGEASASDVRARATERLVLDAPACGAGGTAPGGGPGGGGGNNNNGNVIPPRQDYTGPSIAAANADRCDFLDTAVCLQPWPNDHFTVPDPSMDSGRRVELHLQSMPRNQPLGLPVPVKPIDPTEFNRNDGFSPGNMLITRVPGLDNPDAFDNTGAVSIDDPGAYDDPNQPIVVINAETGERHPVWSEIDFNPLDPVEGGDPDDPENRADVNLLIRPLVNFEEGTRYVVGLRNLKDENGDTIEPSDAFRVYRDNLINTDNPAIEDRRDEMEELFEILGRAGIQRSGLYLTWDFTVASERNLSERMLSIRDRAFDALNDSNLANGTIEGDPPGFTIDTVTPLTEAEDDRIARQVSGTVTVPCFMTPTCAPVGASFNYLNSEDGLPVQNGTVDVPFTCRIPRVALDGPAANPGRPSLYGHGLLGSMDEVNSGNVRAMANEHNFTFCATDWYGFATQNIPNILLILQDLSLFPLLADGSQQGFLNFLYLGRALAHPQGLATDPAFQGPDGPDADSDPDPVIQTGRLFYDGNSQGGIMGGGLTAVAPDFRRAVLGVPGMNYSTLLRRSVDFELYAKGEFGAVLEEVICDQLDAIPVEEIVAILVPVCATAVPDDTPLGLYDNYPDELERPLILSLMQMLWDRAEANGYAQHMTADPLPNTPSHEVLLHAAFGDHQVANVTAEVEARTIGARIYQPALDPGRHWEDDGVDPLFGLQAIPAFPFGGSALVYWDGGPLGFPRGTATPPNENVPPRSPTFGEDPHSYPRNDPLARLQKSAFLRVNGELVNPCNDSGVPRPCYAHGWLGP